MRIASCTTKKLYKSQAGFSLIEMLVVVIITAIFTLGTAAIMINYMEDLQLRRLDNAAREIYMAAQNNATKIQVNGNLENVVKKLPQVGAGENEKFRYLHSTDLENEDPAKRQLCEELLPKTSISPMLWSDDFYVIYAADGSGVLDVFFSKEPLTGTALEIFSVKGSANRRISQVGYFGVGTSGSTASPAYNITTLRTPYVEIQNGETLDAKIIYWEKEMNSVELACVMGSYTLPTVSPTRTQLPDGTYQCEVFYNNLDTGYVWGGPEADEVGNFTLYANVTVVSTAADGSAQTTLSNTGFDTANKWYDHVDYDPVKKDGTIYIANVRHLQNLSVRKHAKSLAWNGVNKVVQISDINCHGFDKDSNGNNIGYTFEPIFVGWASVENGHNVLQSFDGQGYTIYNLKVQADLYEPWAGLFMIAPGTQDPNNPTVFKNITIDNFETIGNGNFVNPTEAGAIAAVSFNYNTFENVTVNNARFKAAPVQQKGGGNNDWATVGGIVGFASQNNSPGANAKFKNCTVTNTQITVENFTHSQPAEYAGGILGLSTVQADFEGCQVYWEPEQSKGEAAGSAVNNMRSKMLDSSGNYKNLISAGNAGGIAGSITSGTMVRSFASTTMGATTAAGGLIGDVVYWTFIKYSYSDCILSPLNETAGAAGFIGAMRNPSLEGNVADLSYCYAAGYINSKFMNNYFSDCGNKQPRTANYVYTAMARTMDGISAGAESWNPENKNLHYGVSATVKPHSGTNISYLSLEKSAAEAIEGYAGASGDLAGGGLALSENQLTNWQSTGKFDWNFESKMLPKAVSSAEIEKARTSWSNTYYVWPDGGEKIAGLYTFPGLYPRENPAAPMPHYGGWWLPKGVVAFRDEAEPFNINTEGYILLGLSPGTETGGQWIYEISDVTPVATETADQAEGNQANGGASEGTAAAAGGAGVAAAAGAQSGHADAASAAEATTEPEPLAEPISAFETITFGFTSNGMPALKLKTRDDEAFKGKRYKITIKYSNKEGASPIFNYSKDIYITIS